MYTVYCLWLCFLSLSFEIGNFRGSDEVIYSTNRPTKRKCSSILKDLQLNHGFLQILIFNTKFNSQQSSINIPEESKYLLRRGLTPLKPAQNPFLGSVWTLRDIQFLSSLSLIASPQALPPGPPGRGHSGPRAVHDAGESRSEGCESDCQARRLRAEGGSVFFLK